MAGDQLPSRPNLEQLRRRARDLLKAARAGDLAALERLGPGLRIQLAAAQALVAREYGFSSWSRLKRHVEAVVAASEPSVELAPASPFFVRRRAQRRGPRQMPSVKYIEGLRAAVVVAAAAGLGEPYPFIFAPPLGPLRSAVQMPLRQALLAHGDLPVVVDVLLRGAEHPNPKVRFECTHAMDWLADERCLPTLLKLVNDPVPRVRRIAMHSLICDDCKLTPLPSCPDVVPLITTRATSDPSPRVRQAARYALGLVVAMRAP